MLNRPTEVPACDPELVVVAKRLSEIRQRLITVKERLLSKRDFIFGGGPISSDNKAQLKGNGPGVIGDIREALYDIEEIIDASTPIISDIERL
jgi:hypothetical protein